MQPLRLGVIGAGLIWIRTHKPILETLQDTFTPAAFCELSEQRRADLAQEYPQAFITADQNELLARPDIDIVLVLTPLALNARTARAVLEAGKNVIMEKPIARSVAEGQELLAVARQAGKRIIVTEQMGYRSAEQQLHDLIAAGTIGELVMWDMVQHFEPESESNPLRYENTPWRKAADFPLGTLFDGGIHTIAGLSKVFGAPETIFATGKSLRDGYGAYDHVAMLFHYANASSGTLSHSSFLPPSGNHFSVYGTAGVISMDRKTLRIQPKDGDERTIDLTPENPYQPMWQAIAAAVREDRDPWYNSARALQDVAILEAVDASIRSDQAAPVAQIPGIQH